MTITFPIDLPAGGDIGGVVSQSFEVQRLDVVSPENRGRVSSVAQGFPLWRMILTLGNTTEAETGAWSSFVAVLRGAARQFKAWDLTRPYPLAYPNGFDGMVRAGGGAFDGTALTWSLNETRDVVTITGLPEEFQVNQRDYLGFRWGTSKFALVRSVEAVTGDTEGEIAFTVEPPVPGGEDYEVVPEDAVAYFDRPVCLMRLTRETSIGPQDHLHTLGGTIAAIQDLRP